MADNKHRGQTLDSFLEEEGVLVESQIKATEEVIAWQLAGARLDQTIKEVRSKFDDLPPAELEALIDKAVSATRQTPKPANSK